MAEDNGRLGELQHGAGRLPGGVGEVDDHPQPVHLLHHRLHSTAAGRLTQSRPQTQGRCVELLCAPSYHTDYSMTRTVDFAIFELFDLSG